MISKKIVFFSLKSLQKRSFRSWLTIIGIVFSIAVIFLLFSFSAILENSVVNLFEDFGTNRIFISPNSDGFRKTGSLEANVFSENDIRLVEKIPQVENVIEQIYRTSVKATYSREDQYISVVGLPLHKNDLLVENYKFQKNLIDGRNFKNNEKSVAIVGYSFVDDSDSIFDKHIELKKSIQIFNESFKVIGVYKKTGTSDDSLIYIPMANAKIIFSIVDEVDLMDVIISKTANINFVSEKIEHIFDRKRGEDSITLVTPDSYIRSFKNILFYIQVILLSIALISLFVGSIGIMNSLFTSVLEREKEIGIMKSIGAKNKDILFIFILESGFIGLIGGILGVILGLIILFIIKFVLVQIQYDLLIISINYIYIIICLLFSFCIGIISGFFPSYIASKKKIVEIMREQ